MNENPVPTQEKTPPPFASLCGRVFQSADPRFFPQAEYRGRTVCFCTESCLGAFLADPDLFYAVHRPKKKPTPNS